SRRIARTSARRATPLRPPVAAPWLPRVLAAVTAAVGVVNVASVLTPALDARAEALHDLGSAGAVPVAHALALPTGVGLVLVATYLGRRRRRAWAVATALLAGAGILNLLKGLDVEEALLSWAVVGLLLWGRDAFTVVHAPGGLRHAAARAAYVLAGAAAGALAATLIAGRPPGAGPLATVRHALALLTLTGGPLHADGHVQWLPVGVGIIGVGAASAAAAFLFAPLATPHRPAGPWARRAARALLERYGGDTLGFFKLRTDLRYMFSPAGDAFLAYRVEGRVLLVSGDPVGPPAGVAPLVRHLLAYAQTQGLRVAILGASDHLAGVYADAGLRRMYIGDEAVLDVASFHLEGRAIRKVRQSVTRLERAGYVTEVRTVASLGAAGLAELEAVSARWRAGVAERGFSMAMEGLGGPEQADTLVVVARDADGRARGHLHLVPCFGRDAASLSQMRRDPDTPNGLTEFLVVRAAQALRERGVAELSLNFAVFARYLRTPHRLLDRAAARVIRRLDRHFQIERLYRFNAKFSPAWTPRYLVWDGALGLPRCALAALRAEGQLPRLGREPAADAA
ncbi:MAG: phosphatidylglycerol lysyltransferase domain-containing protein, partial [Actinomycetota bacterium]